MVQAGVETYQYSDLRKDVAQFWIQGSWLNICDLGFQAEGFWFRVRVSSRFRVYRV